MSSVRILSRRRLMRRFLSAGRYHVEGAWWKAVRRAEDQGHIVNPRDYGPAEGRVCLIGSDDELAPMVAAVLQGRRGFPRGAIEDAAGGSLGEWDVLRRLADVGLGLLEMSDDSVVVKAGHPRLTRIVNAARHHLGRRGFDARTLAAAVLDLPRHSVRRVSQLQRVQVVERLLDDWSIGAFDLLEGRRRVRLHSDWRVRDEIAAA